MSTFESLDMKAGGDGNAEFGVLLWMGPPRGLQVEGRTVTVRLDRFA